MADSNIIAFRTFNEDINKNILSDPEFAVIEATGNTRRSLLDDSNVTINSVRFTKRVVGYYRSIDKGRGQNTKKNPSMFPGIFDWLEHRKYGFDWKDSKERTSMAIAIMRKIAKSGSSKFRGDTPKTRIFEKGVNDAVPALLKNLVTLRVIGLKGIIKESYTK